MPSSTNTWKERKEAAAERVGGGVTQKTEALAEMRLRPAEQGAPSQTERGTKNDCVFVKMQRLLSHPSIAATYGGPVMRVSQPSAERRRKRTGDPLLR